jgi:anti-sigma B factor antagonist
MPSDPLVIEDLLGPKDGHRTLRLKGPLVIATLFEFQARVRANSAPVLIIDFNGVPYVDSAGVGALVGAYVSHQKDGRRLHLVGVCDRVHHALQVTRVDHFFQFFPTVADAENG